MKRVSPDKIQKLEELRSKLDDEWSILGDRLDSARDALHDYNKTVYAIKELTEEVASSIEDEAMKYPEEKEQRRYFDWGDNWFGCPFPADDIELEDHYGEMKDFLEDLPESLEDSE